MFSCNKDKTYTPKQLMEMEMKMKRDRRHHGYAKADKPNKFLEYLNAIKIKDGDNQPQYPTGYQQIELEKALNRLPQLRTASVSDGEQWIFRGPSNVPGRTRGLALVPNSPNNNTWFCGSVGGGIWKTTNGGASWTNITPDLTNLSTTSIVIAPSNPDIIYVGTGEIYAGFGGIDGIGILKSIDGGNTFELLSSTANNEDFRNTNRIVVDPNNENILVAATTNGYWNLNTGEVSRIMRSEDGGNTWAKVYSSTKSIDHIVAAPSNFNVQYASINSGSIIKSIDAGKSWQVKTDGFSSQGRAELAVSPSNANKVYASVEGNISGNGSDLFFTSNGGENWYTALNPSISYDFLGGQGWFDNTILVHPYDDNIVYVGGVNLFKFEITNTTPTGIGDIKILRATEEGTEDFMTFVTFQNASYNFGNISIQTDDGVGISQSEFVSVEMRFGPGKSQKAHRFMVPAGQTSGVPYSNYSYMDYVDVPFEIWDITNNKQLMVSFRDQDRNGVFNLNDGNEDDLALSREYVFIHKIDYNATTPSPQITVNGGNVQRAMYFFWPIASAGSVWNANNLPESKFSIIWGRNFGVRKNSKVVSDAYNQFSGPNRFFQVTGETQVSGLHPDHHNLMAIKVNEAAKTFKIINANDGGIYTSSTSATPGEANNSWFFTSTGLATTQFYGVDKRPGQEEYIGGTQDNGTWKSPISADATSPWSRMLGGDGFEVVWRKDNDQFIIASIYENELFRSADRGEKWSSSISGLSDVGEGKAPFITRIANNPKDPATLFVVGNSGVWKSINFGTRWTGTSINAPSWIASSFNQVHVSLANPNIVWAGSGMFVNDGSSNRPTRSLFVSTNKANSFLPATIADNLGAISGMASHPTKDSVFYALFSFYQSPKIYRTKDLGKTWEDISGFKGNTSSTRGFPDVAVYSLLVRPDSTNIIWAGTEIGIVESKDNGETWQLYNGVSKGLPFAAIWDMKVVDNQVIVATHGRGIYTFNLEGYEIPLPTSLKEDILSLKEIKVFPNPAQSEITLSFTSDRQMDVEVVVYDIQGKQMMLVGKEPHVSGTFAKRLNITALNKGTYFLVLRRTQDKQAIHREKFIKM